jgi:predicted small secreted protein
MDRLSERLNLIISNSYGFSWTKIPGTDDKRLKEFLGKKYNIEWVYTAGIAKSGDGKTINISNEDEDKTLSLTLNDEDSEATLKIDNIETDKFIAKEENGELNIYSNSNRNEEFKSIAELEKIQEIFLIHAIDLSSTGIRHGNFEVVIRSMKILAIISENLKYNYFDKKRKDELMKQIIIEMCTIYNKSNNLVILKKFVSHIQQMVNISIDRDYNISVNLIIYILEKKAIELISHDNLPSNNDMVIVKESLDLLGNISIRLIKYKKFFNPLMMNINSLKRLGIIAIRYSQKDLVEQIIDSLINILIDMSNIRHNETDFHGFISGDNKNYSFIVGEIYVELSINKSEEIGNIIKNIEASIISIVIESSGASLYKVIEFLVDKLEFICIDLIRFKDVNDTTIVIHSLNILKDIKDSKELCNKRKLKNLIKQKICKIERLKI